MEEVRFKAPVIEGYEIKVGLGKSPRVPFISYYSEGEFCGVVHFFTESEWRRFLNVLGKLEIESKFKQDTKTDSILNQVRKNRLLILNEVQILRDRIEELEEKLKGIR